MRHALPWFTHARIVGLGDATHGTHEFFTVKKQLIEMLVRDAGFRTIAFEAPYAEWERIREYVATGAGNPAAALESRDYYFWDAQEVLEVIEWARAENARGIEPPVVVAGVDASHPHPAIELVVSSIADKTLRADVERRYNCLAQYRLSPNSYPGAEWCRDSILSVRPMLPEALHHAARVVEQGEEYLRTNLRDAALAENLGRFDGRVIFWGHNAHVGKTPYQLLGPELITSAGMLLDDYVAIGTVALRGRFWAYEFGVLNEQEMTPAGEDDYAMWFSKANVPAMIVPLRGSLPRWLSSPRTTRFAGSAVVSRNRATIEVIEDFARRYDAVIYFEETTPSRLRHFPRW